jgi:hypothetical protein
MGQRGFVDCLPQAVCTGYSGERCPSCFALIAGRMPALPVPAPQLLLRLGWTGRRPGAGRGYGAVRVERVEV